MQAVSDLLRICVDVAHLVAQQQRREGRIIIDNQLAVAVIDLAARSQDWHFLDAVLLRARNVLFTLAHLKSPQTISKKDEDCQNDILDD